MCAAKPNPANVALASVSVIHSTSRSTAMGSTEDINITRLLDLDSQLSEANLEEFIAYIRVHYNLKNIFYFCPSLPGRSIANPYILGTYREDWITHYRENNYVALDPVINIGARSLLPIDWNKLPRKSPKVQRFFNEAMDFGVGRQGLTIPVRGPTNGLWALFCMTADDTYPEWQGRHYELIRDMVHVAYFVQQRSFEMNIQDDGININTITKREIEALSWSAEGKTIDDTALIMSISPETVKAHLDSARFKLGALNRVHAVAKAIRAGLIR